MIFFVSFDSINDNEFLDTANAIFVAKDKVYYIDKDINICSMDLNGNNKTIIAPI